MDDWLAWKLTEMMRLCQEKFQFEPRLKSSLVVAAVCDRHGLEEISPANGAHRAPLQGFCRNFSLSDETCFT
jgi:hypothetical protein